MAKSEKLKFDKYEVTIDPENLRFDENNLSEYIQKEGGHYDNFGGYLAMAERHLQNKEVLYEKLYCERFEEAKELGASDKLAEAKSKKDVDVVSMKEEVIEARYSVNRLKNHLKAWDKNHDNAQSLGHMLRKQMDKLNSDIMGKFFGDANGREVPGLDHAVEDSVKSFQDSGEFESNLSAENLF
jgi:hypothetical protein